MLDDLGAWLKAHQAPKTDVIRDEIIPIQQEVAKKYGLQVIDLHTLFAGANDLMLDDGIHPNGKGAHRLAELIAKEIKQ